MGKKVSARIKNKLKARIAARIRSEDKTLHSQKYNQRKHT